MELKIQSIKIYNKYEFLNYAARLFTLKRKKKDTLQQEG